MREFLFAANDSPFQVDVLPGLKEIERPEENGSTFAENSAAKAVYYSSFTDELVLADDSGLEVDALNGEPGIYSARYAGETATDSDNNALLLRKMAGQPVRNAAFISVVTLAQRGNILASGTGSVQGEILMAPRGENGFGYDPLFFYPPFGRSFGEIDLNEKLSVSHRGRALQAAIAALSGQV